MKNQYGHAIVMGRNGHTDEKHAIVFFHNEIKIINISIEEAASLLCKHWFNICYDNIDYFINYNKNFLPFHYREIGFRFINIETNNVTIAIENNDSYEFKFIVPDFGMN